MRLFIHHDTRYSFSQPQRRLVQLLRLTPSSFAGQSVIDWQVDVDRDAGLKTSRDGFGNETTMLYVDGPLDCVHIHRARRGADRGSRRDGGGRARAAAAGDLYPRDATDCAKPRDPRLRRRSP